MTGTRYGTFEELTAGADPHMAGIAGELRRIVYEVDPDAVEVVRLGDRAATYGVGRKKMTEGYAYIMPQRNHVNLGFYRGALLDDPNRLLEGTGQAMRHVKVRSVAEARHPALRTLLSEARMERRRALA